MAEFDPFAAAPAADEAQSTQAPSPETSPFDAPPADVPNATQEAPISTATVARPVASNDGKVVLTFKGGTGFDAPWIVIHAADLQDAADQVSGSNASLLADTMAKVQKAGEHFAGLAAPKTAAQNGNSGGGGGGRAPQAAQSAPGGQSKTCAHGEMQFRSGVSAKTGKAWKAFFCPTPKGTPGQCDAEFIR
jgi:hypothetical protein